MKLILTGGRGFEGAPASGASRYRVSTNERSELYLDYTLFLLEGAIVQGCGREREARLIVGREGRVYPPPQS